MTKRRKTAEQWQEIVGRWRASGLSAREFASQEGVVTGTLSWWATRLGREAGSARSAAKHGRAFTRVRVTSQAPVNASGHVEIVAVSGIVVRVMGAVSEAALTQVLRAVQSC